MFVHGPELKWLILCRYETLTRHSISSLWSLLSSTATTVSLTSLSHADAWFVYCLTPATERPCSPVATKGRFDGYPEVGEVLWI
jgi:hypothetical protein